jgi:hypothetical protein
LIWRPRLLFDVQSSSESITFCEASLTISNAQERTTFAFASELRKTTILRLHSPSPPILFGAIRSTAACTGDKTGLQEDQGTSAARSEI